MRTLPFLLSVILALTPAYAAFAQNAPSPAQPAISTGNQDPAPQQRPIPVPPVKMTYPGLVSLWSTARFGTAKEQTELGLIYLGQRGIPADYAQAGAWLKKAADQGYGPAQLWLGLMHSSGDGAPQNAEIAAEWLRKAADQGIGSAQFKLGEMYKEGTGVPQDAIQAWVWLDLAAASEDAWLNGNIYTDVRDAAAANMTEAQISEAKARKAAWKPASATPDQQVNSAWEAINGNRFDEAMKILQPLAQEGHRQAQFLIALLYRFGEGAAQDNAMAAHWNTKAAEQGHPMAQTALGLSYVSGEGVPQDDKKAREWLRKAADQDMSLAQYFLAKLLSSKRGGPKNSSMATSMLLKAAQQGHGDAQHELGVQIAGGQGMPMDRAAAYKWIGLAEIYGVHESMRTDLINTKKALARNMTPDQLSEADKQIAAWVPTFPVP